jgi:SAM-dependent methyltransferase
MVSRDDVINAYRYILGREPENSAAIDAHLYVSTVSELREIFLQSPEFLHKMSVQNVNIEDWFPPQTLSRIQVDCEANAEQLKMLLDRIRLEWESFGNSEPHWSVLTHGAYKKEFLEKNKTEFFESGRFVTQIIETFSSRQNINIPTKGTCLELGCGVGRITIHLARLFKSVIGVDISRFHLDVCREELKRADINNAILRCLESPQHLEDLPEFEFFCSFIVLQHNPPPVIVYLLELILNKLARGGLAIFQVPTYRRNYSFNLEHYLNYPTPPHMEMHVLPQPQIFKIIKRTNCQLLEVREDGWAEGRTPECISNTFFVVKE